MDIVSEVRERFFFRLVVALTAKASERKRKPPAIRPRHDRHHTSFLHDPEDCYHQMGYFGSEN